jgi:hypothetical protein
MKHPGWLLVITGAFSLLQSGWPWIIAGTFCFGFMVGCFVGTRTTRPERAVPRRAAQQMEPPPVRFVRTIDLQGDLFTPNELFRTDDAPPLVDLGPEGGIKLPKR